MVGADMSLSLCVCVCVCVCVRAQNDNPRLNYKVEVSYMEIYCEKVRDLLCPKG